MFIFIIHPSSFAPALSSSGYIRLPLSKWYSQPLTGAHQRHLLFRVSDIFLIYLIFISEINECCCCRRCRFFSSLHFSRVFFPHFLFFFFLFVVSLVPRLLLLLVVLVVDSVVILVFVHSISRVSVIFKMSTQTLISCVFYICQFILSSLFVYVPAIVLGCWY